MNPSLLVAECLATPWALMPERLHALASVVTRWSVGNAADPDILKQIEIDRVAREIRRASNAAPAPSGIAVLPLYGVITQRGNMVDAVSGPGMTSTQQFSAALRELVADKSVSQILIDIDSPGGSVYGVCELADEIMAARAQKPVVAIANSLAASAAYWIGCAASEFYVTPGGEVGSIGVWQAHQDFSRALDEAGVTTTLISAGKFKVEGNPYSPLDSEAQSFMQSRVDEYYAAFAKAVSRGRGIPIAQVRDGMGQGRVVGAQVALEQNMVDGVATLEDVLSRMQKRDRQSPPGLRSRTSQIDRARAALVLLGYTQTPNLYVATVASKMDAQAYHASVLQTHPLGHILVPFRTSPVEDWSLGFNVFDPVLINAGPGIEVVPAITLALIREETLPVVRFVGGPSAEVPASEELSIEFRCRRIRSTRTIPGLKSLAEVQIDD